MRLVNFQGPVVENKGENKNCTIKQSLQYTMYIGVLRFVYWPVSVPHAEFHNFDFVLLFIASKVAVER